MQYEKEIIRKDIFYLSLFICVCLVAFGGILFTNKNLNKLVASKDTINKDNEINLEKKKMILYQHRQNQKKTLKRQKNKITKKQKLRANLNLTT